MTNQPEAGPSCITCGDVAMALTVVSLAGDDAICQAPDGGRERVAVDLVAPVAVGDVVLVHAAVALCVLSPKAAEGEVGAGQVGTPEEVAR